MKRIMRDVTSHEYCGASRYTGYVARSVRLFLSCGHESVRKSSQGVPRRAKCHECTRDQPDAETDSQAGKS